MLVILESSQLHTGWIHDTNAIMVNTVICRTHVSVPAQRSMVLVRFDGTVGDSMIHTADNDYLPGALVRMNG